MPLVKKKHKIVISKGTPGDSKIFHTSNLKLKKLYPQVKFTKIRSGLIKYFNWINKLPNKRNIKSYHPLRIN